MVNMLPYLKGATKEGPREFLFYFSDDGDIFAVRMGDWKVVLIEQPAKQLMCWLEPFVSYGRRRFSTCGVTPSSGPIENSNTYWDWVISHAYLLYECRR